MEFRLLKADEIECRIASIKEKGLSLLLYKDARVDQNILDETVGSMSWQRKHEVINGNLFCSVGIHCKELDEWIWKQDVGVESYTEKEKGQASDAFKRACFNWGIGRELYTAPFIWISAGNFNVTKDGKCYDKFKVKNIGYKDHKITELTIINESLKNKVVFQLGKSEEPKTESTKTEEDIGNMKISKIKVDIIKADIDKGLFDEAALLKWFKVEKLEDVTEKLFAEYVRKKKAKE